VAVEYSSSNAITSFDMDGFTVGSDGTTGSINSSPDTYINWCFKRAPKVFDVVCYNGTSVAKTEAHGLGVIPELIIQKNRTNTYGWVSYCAYTPLGLDGYLAINDSGPSTSGWATMWNSSAPTASVFSLGTQSQANESGAKHIAWLFATLAGVSKVGNYTGNGTTKTIACGFAAGARFVMVKRTDAVGDWYVWDTARGIIAGNDPHLSMNTTAIETTTDDSIDPDSSGFIVNQLSATNINVNNATYIFLAFA
jgi:hypothetical protein